MKRNSCLAIAAILSGLNLCGCVTTSSSEAQSDGISISFSRDHDDCCKKCCKHHKDQTFLGAVIQAGLDAAVD